jgi:hypothetical protein
VNEARAREILGCTPDATFKELKSSYRKMIMLVHPDKAAQDEKSQSKAKESSSRLNEAWEYLEKREQMGLLGTSENEHLFTESASRSRSTYPHECDVCGFAPATKIVAPMVSTFIYFFRKSKYELNACKNCGIAMSRMALRQSLIKGWWGLGIVFMPNVIYRYFENLNRLKKIGNPSFRDPDVVTLSDYPFMIPKSPFKEPVPLVASLIAIFLIASLFFGGSSGSSPYQAPDDYFGKVGTCYEEVSSDGGQKIGMVDCDNTSATLRSIAVVVLSSYCPSTTMYTTTAEMPDGTTKTACLSRI